MTAAALTELFKDLPISISLIESNQVGTVGVGEATLPHLRFFNQRLGINEPEFMKFVNATYKLGIEFVNWGQIGDAYIHPFGDFGVPANGVDFHHYWLKARAMGLGSPIGRFSLPVVAALEEKFDFPRSDRSSWLSTYSYAYHIDAGLYAKYLREFSEQRGLIRVEGLINDVALNPCTGFVESVRIEGGQSVEADLFIDCSGFRGLLIEQALKTGYEHWNKWLPCDRAIAIPSASNSSPLPYTRATADSAGWRWRIPLQNRVGNGHVYCSDYISDDDAEMKLRDGLDGEALASANRLRFNTGRRRKMWNKNVVAIGLSGGFLEPLESTGIHLIQLAIMKLIEFFPDREMEPQYQREFNRSMDMEINRIKNFLILHYNATARDDTEFWRYVRSMSLPTELEDKIELFKETGHMLGYREGLFLEPSWVAVFLGQRVWPKRLDPRLAKISEAQLLSKLNKLEKAIKDDVDEMPLHVEALDDIDSQVRQGWRKTGLNLYGR